MLVFLTGWQTCACTVDSVCKFVSVRFGCSLVAPSNWNFDSPLEDEDTGAPEGGEEEASGAGDSKLDVTAEVWSLRLLFRVCVCYFCVHVHICVRMCVWQNCLSHECQHGICAPMKTDKAGGGGSEIPLLSDRTQRLLSSCSCCPCPLSEDNLFFYSMWPLSFLCWEL